MKTNLPRRGAAALCALFCLSLLVPALAAESAPRTVTAQPWVGYVWAEGVDTDFLNESGRPVELFAYRGTIYMPLRTAGEWMGCTVTWEQETRTAALTSGTDNVFRTAGEAPALNEEELAIRLHNQENGMAVSLSPDISVTLDGRAVHFENVNGEAVCPVVYRQVTYLPLRSIGELCGLTVSWVPGEADRRPDSVHLRSAAAPGDIASVKTYLEAMDTLPQGLDKLLAVFSGQVEMDNAQGLAALRAVEDYLDRMADIPAVSTPWLKLHTIRVADAAAAFRAEIDGCITELERGSRNLSELLENDLYNTLLASSVEPQLALARLHQVMWGL